MIARAPNWTITNLGIDEAAFMFGSPKMHTLQELCVKVNNQIYFVYLVWGIFMLFLSLQNCIATSSQHEAEMQGFLPSNSNTL